MSEYLDLLRTSYSLESLSVSPEGNKLAYVKVFASDKPGKPHREIHLLDLRTKENFAVSSHSGSVSTVFSDENKLVYSVSERNESQIYVYLTDRKINKEIAKLDLNVSTLRLLSSSMLVFSARSYIESEDEDCVVLEDLPAILDNEGTISGSRRGLYFFNLETMDLEKRTTNNFDLSYFSVYGSRIVVVGQQYTSARKAKDGIFLLDLKNDCRFKYIEHDREFISEAFSWSENEVIYLGTNGSRDGMLQALDLRLIEFAGVQEQWSRTIMAAEEMNGRHFFDLRSKGNSFLLSTGSGLLQCVNNSIGSGSLIQYSEALKHLGRYEFPGHIWEISKASECDSLVYFIGSQEFEAPEIYSLDLTEAKISKLTQLAGSRNASYKSLKFKKIAINSFGKTISTSIIEPEQVGDYSKSAAAIVVLHNGFTDFYSTEFLAELTMWSEQGFYVIVPDLYLEDYKRVQFSPRNRIFGDLVAEDIKNLLDEIQKLYPSINENKRAVLGREYGGIIAQELIAKSRLFACAAVESSVGDWIVNGYSSDLGYMVTQDMFSPDAIVSADKAWSYSPARLAVETKCPLLIVQGELSRSVPLEDVMATYAATIRSGSKVRMCIMHDEYGCLKDWSLDHQKARLTELRNWVSDYLGDTEC